MPVFEDGEKDAVCPDLTKCNTSTAVLLTGIANPKPIRDYLQKFFKEITELKYPDHHSFNENDLTEITSVFNSLPNSSGYIITTEKDAVRLREFSNIDENIKSALFYIPVGISFLNDDKTEFDNLIIDYVRKSKQNIRISKR